MLKTILGAAAMSRRLGAQGRRQVHRRNPSKHPTACEPSGQHSHLTRKHMKRTSASPTDTLSPLGAAVLVGDAIGTAAGDRNLLLAAEAGTQPLVNGASTIRAAAPSEAHASRA
jgi:hypothetical protein